MLQSKIILWDFMMDIVITIRVKISVNFVHQDFHIQ